MSAIGLGLITYKRPNNLRKILDTINPSKFHSIVIVNDTPGGYNNFVYPSWPNLKVIQHPTNLSVCITKNDALKYLMEQGCSYLFLQEDDIIVTNDKIFDKYISLSEVSGIHHFNFGYHGPANMKDGKPNPKFCIEYDDENKLAVNQQCVGALSMFTKEVIEKVGYHDENLNQNCWEHVSLAYRIIKQNYHPPFWNFVDVMDSYDYVKELEDVSKSVIRKDNWARRMGEGRQYFLKKHGIDVLGITQTSQDGVVKWLAEHERKCITNDTGKNIYMLWCTAPNRSEMFKTTLLEWLRMASEHARIDLVVGVNEEGQQKELLDYYNSLTNEQFKYKTRSFSVKTLGNVKGVPACCHELIKDFEAEHPYDILLWNSDDFFPPVNMCWDEFLIDKFKDNKDKCLIVRDGFQPNDSPMVTIPILTFGCLLKMNRVLYSKLFKHCYSDNLLWLNLLELGLIEDIRCYSEVVFEHRHKNNGKRKADEVDRYADETFNEDEIMFTKVKQLPLELRLNPDLRIL